jgi:hypothetical protein
MNKWHHLKCQQPYFNALWRGEKTFELRRNDRGFEVGDCLYIFEYYPQVATDKMAWFACWFERRSLLYVITYILPVKTFVPQADPEMVILGIKPITPLVQLRLLWQEVRQAWQRNKQISSQQ